MTLDTVIMFVGAIVAVLPFLGFPDSWDTIFFFILGVLVICLGIAVRRRRTNPTGMPRRLSHLDDTPTE